MAVSEQFPAGLDSKRCFLSMLGPLALGVSLGIQVTMTAFLFLGPSSDAAFVDELTEFGKASVRPEHDLPIYASGVLFTLAAILIINWWWRDRLKRVPTEHLETTISFGTLIQTTAAATSMVLYLGLVFSRFVSQQTGVGEAPDPLVGCILLLPSAMALAWTLLDMSYGWAYLGEGSDWVRRWHFGTSRLLLYTIPILILLLIGIPPESWTYLAGREFLAERCSHLNWFMGPALSFAHGKAFGAEIFSAYGIGWPLLCSWLSHFSAMTYGNLMGMGMVFGCVYYVTLFLLLRNYLKDEAWAALGVILAIYWQIFSGVTPGQVIWQFPSSTMMRHPMDVWFFLALLTYRRSGGMVWAALAGLISALGVFLETETGVYLLVTFLVYWVLQAGLSPVEGRPMNKRDRLLPLLVFYTTVAATLLPLMLYASRGTLLTQAFWRGWVEPLVRFGSWGLSALPIAELPISSIVFFLAMLAVYLGVIGYTALRSLRRVARPDEVLLASVAVYGLALLLNFVSRSHPYNLYHPAVPFAIVLTALAFQARKALASTLRYSAFPCILTSGMIVLLCTKPEFRCYPSFLTSFGEVIPPDGLSLTSNPKDVSGLPQEYEQFVREFKDVTYAIRTIAPDGKNVAIFDVNDTALCYGANVCPWRPCAFIFQMALTKQSVIDVRSDLVQRPPKYVVTRGQSAPRSPSCDFIWAPLYEVVTNRYALVQTVGPYEIWALPQSAMTCCHAAEALFAKGQVSEAIARYIEALRMEPDLSVALNNLAWIRAAHSLAQFRDGAEAVQLAERACRVTRYQQPMLVGTLAAAYAEAGRFDEATATAEKARALALAAGWSELAEKDQELVEIFKAHQPCREPAAIPGTQ